MLEDLFEYLLPAGMHYSINKVGNGSGNISSDVDTSTKISYRTASNIELSKISSEKKAENITSDLLIDTILTGMINSDLDSE